MGAADDVNAYVRRMLVNEYLGWRRRLGRTTPVAALDGLLPDSPDHADRHCEEAALVNDLATLPRKQRAATVPTTKES